MAKAKKTQLASEALGEVAYLAYFASKQGDTPAPAFSGLMPNSQEAWAKAAFAVVDALNTPPIVTPFVSPEPVAPEPQAIELEAVAMEAE
jgi:hypothetical protein